MNDQNLKQIDISKLPNHRELSIKGGRSKSPKKIASSLINLQKANPDIRPEKLYLLKCLEKGDFLELLKQLISLELERCTEQKSRQKLIDSIIKILPQKNLNLNLSPEPQIYKIVVAESKSFKLSQIEQQLRTLQAENQSLKEQLEKIQNKPAKPKEDDDDSPIFV